MPSVRAQVFAVLDQTVHSIQHIDQPTLRAMMPVLMKAQAEVQHALRLWLQRDGGAATFTAQRYRNALIVLNRALASARQMEPVTAEALKHSYKTIGPLALRNLQHEWKTFSAIFEGTAMPLALDEAAVIANGKSLLWPQFETSAERYAGSIGERTRLELAVSRAKSETMDELTNRLQKNLPDIFDGERWDAERLARTETMSAYAQTSQDGLRDALDDDPELKQRWDSSVDFRRCEMCASLDGQVVDIDEPFHAVWTTYSKKGARTHELFVDKPAAHPCCLPGSVEVSSSSRIDAATKRWYDGEIVIIRTALGKHLTATPNHPILTDGGWVPAGLLHVGGNVVCDIGIKGVARGDVDHQHVPTRIEKVAEAFGSSCEVTSAEVPTAAEDFHGDGKGSEVAVVWADRLLLNALDPTLRQHGAEMSLHRADVAQRLLVGEGRLDSAFQRLLHTSHGVVGSTSPGVALLLAHLAHRNKAGLAHPANVGAVLNEHPANPLTLDLEPASNSKLGRTSHIGSNGGVLVDGFDFDAQGNSHLDQAIRNGGAADSQVLLDGSDGFPEKIALDDIVSVQCEPFHGFVYNLQTDSGHYTAGGVIVHNCRCITTPWRESWAKYSRRDEGGERAAA